MALDCEYDLIVANNMKAPCKVTIVDHKGQIILDTLINQRGPKGEDRELKRVPHIHGIETADLIDAPEFSKVRDHIREIIDPKSTIIIGHSIKHDLLVMELTGYHFIDTSTILDSK